MPETQHLEPCRPPSDVRHVGSATVTIETTHHDDGEFYGYSGAASVIYDINSVEFELIWTTVQILARQFGLPTDSIREALESALNGLDSLDAEKPA